MTWNRSKGPSRSAAELLAKLQKDPDYVARLKRREHQQKANGENYSRMAAPILEELGSKGYQVNTIGDLVRSGGEYRIAIPTLLHWLPRITDLQVKEDLVRTLSVPWARPNAAPVLIDEFQKTDSPGLQWAIANGLAVVADDSVFEDLQRLVQDRSLGKAREMPTLAMGNMRDPRAVTLLIGLLQDEQVVGHAIMALGKLKAHIARSRLKQLSEHPTDWVRKAAMEALAELGEPPVG